MNHKYKLVSMSKSIITPIKSSIMENQIKKGPGRPKGSKNKIKAPTMKSNSKVGRPSVEAQAQAAYRLTVQINDLNFTDKQLDGIKKFIKREELLNNKSVSEKYKQIVGIK